MVNHIKPSYLWMATATGLVCLPMTLGLKATAALPFSSTTGRAKVAVPSSTTPRPFTPVVPQPTPTEVPTTSVPFTPVVPQPTPTEVPQPSPQAIPQPATPTTINLSLPFPIDGTPVYVLRGTTWLQAQLLSYQWSSQAGVNYDVSYAIDNSTELGVPVNRIISLATAQQQGLTQMVYEVSSPAGIQQMLNAHNALRQAYGVPPLTWSPKLAAYAQEWANYLLQTNQFAHRPEVPYGENLASAAGMQLSPDQVVKMWGDEAANYNYAANACNPGQTCGHFTQIVWRNTRQIGCGMARANGRDVWVCNYDPPGNFVNQQPY